MTSSSNESIERIAEAIYDVMSYDEPVGEKPKWVPNGNSFKQDEARRYARAALDAYECLHGQLEGEQGGKNEDPS